MASPTPHDDQVRIGHAAREQQLGAALRTLRLRHDWTQAELAARANLDRTTVARLEQGEGGTVSSLVRLAHALGRDDWLASLAPAAVVSPMALLTAQRQARPRQRASGRRRSSP